MYILITDDVDYGFALLKKEPPLTENACIYCYYNLG